MLKTIFNKVLYGFGFGFGMGISAKLTSMLFYNDNFRKRTYYINDNHKELGKNLYN